MVSIQMKKKRKFTPFCGGTVINELWVVTAKHCTNLCSLEKMLVIAGEHDLMLKEGKTSIFFFFFFYVLLDCL